MTFRAGIIRAAVTAALALTLLAIATGPAEVLADGPNDGHSHAVETGGMSGGTSTQMGDTGSMSMPGTGSTASGGTTAMAGASMSMGIADGWQNDINRVAYPLTALLALAAAIVCYRLIQATGLVDKFALILVGLAFFLVQSLIGVGFYVTDGSLIDMSTLMFVMASFNTVAMAFIGMAFLRWYRMVAG